MAPPTARPPIDAPGPGMVELDSKEKDAILVILRGIQDANAAMSPRSQARASQQKEAANHELEQAERNRTYATYTDDTKEITKTDSPTKGTSLTRQVRPTIADLCSCSPRHCQASPETDM